MKKKVRVAIGVVLVAAFMYGLDDLSARFGVPARAQFSTFTVNRFYKVNEKFNKYSFEPIPPVDERCVNALLPHSGSLPCWYVSRHTMVAINVN